MDQDTLTPLLTEENAAEAALQVIDRFEKDGAEDSIDYDFDLSHGSMEHPDPNQINTSFKFDTISGSLLNQIQQAICDTEEMTDEQAELILSFLMNVRDVINEKYKTQLADKLRTVVLGNAPEDVFPLSNLHVINFEIGEVPPIDFVIVVQKASPKDDIAGGVGQKLMDEYFAQNAEGEGEDAVIVEEKVSLDDVIAERKEAGDPDYKYVTGAYKRKWYFECQLDLFVDYSLSNATADTN